MDEPEDDKTMDEEMADKYLSRKTALGKSSTRSPSKAEASDGMKVACIVQR